MAKKISLDTLRESLALIKSGRATMKNIADETKALQEEIIPVLSDVDPDGVGVKFTDPDTGAEVAGFFQQNDASEYWDTEALIEWLKKEKLWMTCSVRTFDQRRFEDLIQTGQIKASSVRKFKKVGEKPAAFVRFNKPKKGSL